MTPPLTIPSLMDFWWPFPELNPPDGWLKSWARGVGRMTPSLATRLYAPRAWKRGTWA